MEKSRLERIIRNVRNGVGAAICLTAIGYTIAGAYTLNAFGKEVGNPNYTYSAECDRKLANAFTEFGVGLGLACLSYLVAPPLKKKKEENQ
jgi:hypothetical protein